MAPSAPRMDSRFPSARRVGVVLLAATCLGGAIAPSGAAAFSEGFEGGHLRAWSGVKGKPRVQTRAAASGRRALQAPRASRPSYVHRDVSGASVLNTSFRYRAADRRGSLSRARPRVVLRLSANNIRLDDIGGRLVLHSAGGSHVLPGRVGTGWSRVAVRLDAGTGQLRARVGGGRWTTRTVALQPETTILLGDLDTRRNGPAYFDDVAIDARTADGSPVQMNPSQPAPGAEPVGPDPGPAPAGPTRLFAKDSFWNSPLSPEAPLDPTSDLLVSSLVSEVKRVAAVRDGPWMAARQYSTPVYVVGPDQPVVKVKLDNQTLPHMQAAFSAVPIPANARPAEGVDQHMTVWQPSTDTLWEFWKTSKEADGWHADWGGAIRNVSRSPGHYTKDSWPGSEPWWGASATSLPVAGGTMMIDEFKQGRFDHALALALPKIRSGVFSWPAQRTDGRVADAAAIPAGARFRLDPNLDLDSLNLHPFVRMVAEAAQRYGMVVRDTAPSVQLYAEDPAQFGRNPYADFIGPQYPNETDKLLRSFPWEHLELLKMELRQKN